jgi:hypothetical protein
MYGERITTAVPLPIHCPPRYHAIIGIIGKQNQKALEKVNV